MVAEVLPFVGAVQPGTPRTWLEQQRFEHEPTPLQPFALHDLGAPARWPAFACGQCGGPLRTCTTCLALDRFYLSCEARCRGHRCICHIEGGDLRIAKYLGTWRAQKALIGLCTGLKTCTAPAIGGRTTCEACHVKYVARTAKIRANILAKRAERRLAAVG